MYSSESFGRLFWVDETLEFKSCPQFTDGTGDFEQLKSLVIDYIHEDLQKSYDDIGQTAVFENMSAWNCDIFDEIAEDYDLELEEAA